MSIPPSQSLNAAAFARFDRLLREPQKYRVGVHRLECGATLIDAGIGSQGGLAAGLEAARICLADLAEVQVTPGANEVWPGAWVTVQTDWPVEACMASQYAGWSISRGKFFAMGSGPMRLAARKEALFSELELEESPPRVVGLLETRKIPPHEVIEEIATACRVPVHEVFLMVAPTASHAGTLQVVARSVETALHKLHELKFGLRQVEAAWGTAPLPPIAVNDLVAIGWTNDAVLYGASVCLWVNADDAEIEKVLPQVPSCASPDFGRPFLDVFERYQRDFYKIDPLLFSPARVTIYNRRTGRMFSAGQPRPDLLAESYSQSPAV